MRFMSEVRMCGGALGHFICFLCPFTLDLLPFRRESECRFIFCLHIPPPFFCYTQITFVRMDEETVADMKKKKQEKKGAMLFVPMAGNGDSTDRQTDRQTQTGTWMRWDGTC